MHGLGLRLRDWVWDYTCGVGGCRQMFAIETQTHKHVVLLAAAKLWQPGRLTNNDSAHLCAIKSVSSLLLVRAKSDTLDESEVPAAA